MRPALYPPLRRGEAAGTRPLGFVEAYSAAQCRLHLYR